MGTHITLSNDAILMTLGDPKPPHFVHLQPFIFFVTGKVGHFKFGG